MEKEYLSLKEAAELMDCHTLTLNRAAVKGTLPAYKRLNKWYFKREDLLALYKPNLRAQIDAAKRANDEF